MTTVSLPRCPGLGSMVLGLPAGRRWDEEHGGHGGLRDGAMERSGTGWLGDIGDCSPPPGFGVMA